MLSTDTLHVHFGSNYKAFFFYNCHVIPVFLSAGRKRTYHSNFHPLLLLYIIAASKADFFAFRLLYFYANNYRKAMWKPLPNGQSFQALHHKHGRKLWPSHYVYSADKLIPWRLAFTVISNRSSLTRYLSLLVALSVYNVSLTNTKRLLENTLSLQASLSCSRTS